MEKVTYSIEDNENRYVIGIERWEQSLLQQVGIEQSIEMYEVVLQRVAGDSMSSMRTLSVIAQYVYSFLKAHPKGVLYFFCDVHEIQRSKRHIALYPQEYRSQMFSALFDKVVCEQKINDIVNTKISLTTLEAEPAFIHLITFTHNMEAVRALEQQIRLQSKDDWQVDSCDN